jgi:A/G-specific adenine glycosylase
MHLHLHDTSSTRYRSQKVKIQKSIVSWYGKNKRDLPWRNTTDPYRIWIAEVMLQQTQVDQVIPYYLRFLNRFPSLRSLAQSNPDHVLKIWEGLGYYRRARYLRDAARIIVKEFGGKIPNDYARLKMLPGFGEYTCGSVLSIAFNQPYPAVDGNVIRVISRLFRIETDAGLSRTKKEIALIVKDLIPHHQASEFNQSLMELGALICKPKNPLCPRCCWKRFCRAYNELEDPSLLPRKAKRKKRPHFHVAVGIVRKDDRILIAKRPKHLILGNLWEFPGGRKNVHESLEKSCVRNIEKDTKIKTKILHPLFSFKHYFSHYGMTLHFFIARYVSGKTESGQPIRWVKMDALEKFAFSTAHKKAIEKIQNIF